MDSASAVWILLIGATILGAAVIDSVSHRAHVPSAVGYLVLGQLIGLADRQWDLLGEPGHYAFELLAALGIVVLLFRVGLRSHLDRLLEKLRPAALIWFGNVALSGVSAYALARYWADLPVSAALIVATAMTATSIGVATVSWTDGGSGKALETPDGALLIDVAELDDLSAILLMAIVFAIVPALEQQGSVLGPILATGGIFLLKFAGFAGICYLFARYLEKPLTHFAATRRRAPHRMLTVTGAGFVIAAIAGALDFSLAIGALFAGLLFSRDPQAVRAETRFDDIHDFFMPFFFVGIGLNADLTVINGAWAFGLALLLVAAAGKFVGTLLPAALVTSRRGALLIAVSMIPRAEIALVIAWQGLALGIIDNDTYAAIVLVSVGTCLIVPQFISRAIDGGRAGS